jgi:hypothetical protein
MTMQKANPSHSTISNEISRVGKEKKRKKMRNFSEYSLWDMI